MADRRMLSLSFSITSFKVVGGFLAAEAGDEVGSKLLKWALGVWTSDAIEIFPCIPEKEELPCWNPPRSGSLVRAPFICC